MTGTTKTCRVCQRQKPLGEFYLSKSTRDGHRGACKPCDRAETSPEYKRDRYYRRKYGISAAEFDDLWRSQKGRCALCCEPADRPRLDHDHGSGRVRAILCHNCNVGLGHFMDDPEMLVRAIQYLRLHGKSVSVHLD